MKLITFTDELIDTVFDIQQRAYKPLFDKYHDIETNPYTESKDVLLKKYTRENTFGYIFINDGNSVGSVRIIARDNVRKISGLAVLPEYQNKGIAQSALREIEKIHSDADKWVLDTIMQEAGNCHLYEKLGYVRTGEPKIINDKLTIVDYVKNITTHYMKLNAVPFEKMKNGIKTIEVRCNDEKRQLVKVDDIIIFTLVGGNENIKVKVKALYPFPTFKELYSAFDFAEFGCKNYTMQRMLDETQEIYSADQENKHGVLGMRCELV